MPKNPRSQYDWNKSTREAEKLLGLLPAGSGYAWSYYVALNTDEDGVTDLEKVRAGILKKPLTGLVGNRTAEEWYEFLRAPTTIPEHRSAIRETEELFMGVTFESKSSGQRLHRVIEWHGVGLALLPGRFTTSDGAVVDRGTLWAPT